jgi:hypothetical protein
MSNPERCEIPLISVHFPKAGGSAFAAQLQRAYGVGNVLTIYDDDPADPANPLWWNRDWFLKKRPVTTLPYTVVHGHIPIIQYDLIQDARRIVMLREPVQNLISIYFYWQSLFESGASGHAIFEFVKKRRLGLLETAEIPQLRWLMSRTYFGDYDMRRFDVIGVHEQRAAFMKAVSELVGKPLSADVTANVTPPSAARGDAMNDARLLATLRALLSDDLRFYERYARAG